jgi:hypothetical protein
MAYLLIILFGLIASPLWAADQPNVMVFRYHAPDSASDQRDRYNWRVLAAVLERTRAAYGDYKIIPSRRPPGPRQIDSILGGDDVNVTVLPARPDLVKAAIGVRIPIDRGLLGYRVFLIRAADQPRFEAIQTLDDLAKIRIGQRASWMSVWLLWAAGMNVVTGDDYEGLFKMLMAGRFDGLSRGAGEIGDEFDSHSKAYPELAIEKTLLLHHPMGDYFWFRDNEEGKRYAKRVREGLLLMIADGSLKALFDTEFGEKIKRLNIAERRVIELPNPMPEHPEIDENDDWWIRLGR